MNKRCAFSFVVVLLTACGTAIGEDACKLVDGGATAETKSLFSNLRQLGREKLLFGHQNSTYFGLGWENTPDRSDVKTACGDYPAVYGWDLNLVTEAKSGRSPEAIAKRVKEAFARGGVQTFSWHMWNPVSGKNFYDCTPAVAAILPGGQKHAAYQEKLKEVAAFFNSLKSEDGRLIPVIFRPFHEHTGSWFWWGAKHCSKEEYVALWRFTVEYLRDTLGVHQLLYAYAPSKKCGRDGYLERYPGDAYVDVWGYDCYDHSLIQHLDDLRMVVKEAEARGKLAALTECGVPKGMTQAKTDAWYVKDLLAPIRDDPVVRRLVYALVWQNRSEEQYWVPVPGKRGVQDFQAFHADPFTVFERDLPNLYAPAGK